MVGMPKLPPAREWLDMADELEVRGGKLGRSCCGGGASDACTLIPWLTSALSKLDAVSVGAGRV